MASACEVDVCRRSDRVYKKEKWQASANKQWNQCSERSAVEVVDSEFF